MIELYVWGARGSYSISGEASIKYGGNTSCVTVKWNGNHYIFDSGTGIINFGKNNSMIKKATLFFSHTHYDHVIGLPFFKKIWDKDFFMKIYSGTLSKTGGIKNFLNNKLFGNPLFPVAFNDIPAKLDFCDFTPGDEIKCDNNVILKTILLDHPGLAVGYALYIDNKKICYITDTETQEIEFKQKICEFVKDADICIYDSTFTNDEKPQHIGWKHSSWQDAVSVAKISNVKKLVLFHHSPTRSDKELDMIEKEAKSLHDHVVMAKENMLLTL